MIKEVSVNTKLSVLAVAYFYLASSVCELVLLQMSRLDEGLSTHLTAVRSLASVDALVTGKITKVAELFATLAASVARFPRMGLQMRVEHCTVPKSHAADAALEGMFFSM